jgi:hypothetical protein
MEWPVPKDVADIRSFMGITGYYRRFIEGFSKIAYPITSLQNKGTNFKWLQRCQDSFNNMKELLTSVAILKVEDLDKDFIVCVDATKEGLGGVLTQERHIICYESLKSKEHERNYVTHDLQLASIIHALKMWQHYIMGRKFLLLTNNNSVKYLFSQPDLNARQARWLAFLSEFDFEVRHIKGKENKIADALSRKVHGLFEVNISRPKSDLEQKIRTAGISNENYAKMMEELQNSTIDSDKPYLSIDKKGLLLFKNKLYILDLVELKLIVLDEVHKKLYSGHPGYQKTITTFRKIFYWPNMKGETTEYMAR